MWLLWLTALLSAKGAELEQVRIFVGEDHAQVLLIANEAFPRPEVRSVASVGKASARATLSFKNLLLSEDLQSAYSQKGGRSLIPVDRRNVELVSLAVVGAQLQVSVETKRAREVGLTSLSDRARPMRLSSIC